MRSPGLETLPPGLVLRLVPAAVVAAVAWALAWKTTGSIDAPDWLPYAVVSGLILAVCLLAGVASPPGRLALGGAAALAGLAVWDAISIGWSPNPSLARDEALLVAFYVVAYLVGATVVRSERERLGVVLTVIASVASLAVVSALHVGLADDTAGLFWSGRFAFPIEYPNALAALFLGAFWPAAGLAAQRSLPLALRALALGSGTAVLAAWLASQSKGGGVALAASGIVFFAICPSRLRAALPVLLAAALVVAGARQLTEPFRADPGDLAAVGHRAGAVVALLAAAGVVVGLAYAFLDRRLEPSERARKVAGTLVVTVVLAAAGGGIGAFFTQVDHPGRWFDRQWRSFKHLPTKETTSTHLFSLGSNRYDFWRVALIEFRDHPIAGIGAHGWTASYLEHGRGGETPERSHSVEMDALSETGIVGLLLLLGGGGLMLAAVWRRARTSVVGASLLAAGVSYGMHASVDWIWSSPAAGLCVFLLLGAGASPDGERSLPGRAALPAGVVALSLALLAFAPPWLSSRFTDRAYGNPAGARADLRWARRLDPLSTDPLVAEGQIAATRAARIGPLARAVAKEPRREDLRYLLGIAYLDAGRRPEALRELRTALRLYPADALARQALERAR